MIGDTIACALSFPIALGVVWLIGHYVETAMKRLER
jgi:hypothetical protein